MRIAVLLAFALALSAVAAPVPKALKKPSDAELLEGWWEYVTMDDGRGPTECRDKDLIRDGVLYHSGTLRNKEAGHTIRLDPTQTPKRLDVEVPLERVLLGIYQIDGDTLTYCFAQPGYSRPTEFKGSGGTVYCGVLKRAKDEAKGK